MEVLSLTCKSLVAQFGQHFSLLFQNTWPNLMFTYPGLVNKWLNELIRSTRQRVTYALAQLPRASENQIRESALEQQGKVAVQIEQAKNRRWTWTLPHCTTFIIQQMNEWMNEWKWMNERTNEKLHINMCKMVSLRPNYKNDNCKSQ